MLHFLIWDFYFSCPFSITTILMWIFSFPIYNFHWKYLGFSILQHFVFHTCGPTKYVWINIIFSNVCWWENGIIQKNQIFLVFGVAVIDYFTCKRMNVFIKLHNIFSFNSGMQNLTLHFRQILILKIGKTPYYIAAKVYPPMSWFFATSH